jgi:DNA-binding LytR/AlgR family response regulator
LKNLRKNDIIDLRDTPKLQSGGTVLNRKLRVAVCEDLKKDRDLLLSCIRESGISVKCDTYIDGESFLEKYKKGMYHLIYLDIYMGEINGMNTAAAIREKDEDVLLAFTTTSRDYAFEANKYRSILYIEKPVSPQMVNHTLSIACALRDKRQDEILTVYTDAVQVDIPHSDLIYVEVIDQRCILHLRGGRLIAASTTLNINDLEAMLPKPRFCRTHRSFIVNLDMVKRINGRDFEMIEGGVAYITQKDRRRIAELYDEWLFGSVMEEKL